MSSAPSRRREEVGGALADLIAALVGPELEALREEVQSLRRQVSEIQEPRRLVTVEQFLARNPSFSLGELRRLLLHRKTNGLEAAVVGGGKRLKIDEGAFLELFCRRKEEAPEQPKRGRPRSGQRGTNLGQSRRATASITEREAGGKMPSSPRRAS